MCWFCENGVPDGVLAEGVPLESLARERARPGSGRAAAEYLSGILGRVDELGWVVQTVLPQDSRPAWAYTAGLTGRGLPELVVTGLDPALSVMVLNAVAAESLSAGPPGPGDVLALRGGPPMEVVALAEPSVHLSLAITLYGPDVRALQLVYADESGAFPWSPSYRDGRGGQPVLGVRDNG
ncbi:DUF4262 domain-containing protein [Amycolatopsis saalfeldensis]|uniref:DUF4262 domain-containing protein n=1 Tax=Amycolatopsis saalfeldensis TaxID=394193 RepID=A0A1H8QU54_9PSEU|nr:DUF4262 domain-containing protein [Amycolatopsis saalfeldensis]SEO57458.1 protein of unknown function [Amycolatopsis saalfeldensis]